MSVKAYLFLETERGKAKAIAKALGDMPNVKLAHAVTGPYDIIALVELRDIKELGDFVVTKLQGTAGITRTLTNVIVE